MIPFIKKCKDKCVTVFTPANIYILLTRLNHWFLAIALVLFYPKVGLVSRWIDPTAAPLDAGIFSTLYIALLMSAVIFGFATTGQWINHKPTFHQIDDDDKVRDTFSKITPFQSLLFSWLVFVTYLSVPLLCLLAVVLTAS